MMKHWQKWTLGLVMSAAALWYWHLYSKHLDTAWLVSMQMCLVDREQLAPFKNNGELREVVINELIQRKIVGDSLLERVALKNAIKDGLSCEPFDFL
ncbi:hypothetical protein SG34_004100 [Thalassomonas viridans]|uniref:Uncharacterized protein n=1 Tax=Thalassomonas viridans TaxID=137584 RepID=A0AAF0CA42_9GAMM|nr:hypothetical protein [Thalassomonas viridans]WDE06121.1 hypothetical protein SG34_004100 [Thalassomonas viridans]